MGIYCPHRRKFYDEKPNDEICGKCTLKCIINVETLNCCNIAFMKVDDKHSLDEVSNEDCHVKDNKK